jgi:hypothetical protein
MKIEKAIIHFEVPYTVGAASSQRFGVVELFLNNLEKLGFSFRLCMVLDKRALGYFIYTGRLDFKSRSNSKRFF